MSDGNLKLMCPNLLCRRVLSVPAFARGKTVRCRFCSTTMKVPSAPASSKKPAAPVEPASDEKAA